MCKSVSQPSYHGVPTEKNLEWSLKHGIVKLLTSCSARCTTNTRSRLAWARTRITKDETVKLHSRTTLSWCSRCGIEGDQTSIIRLYCLTLTDVWVMLHRLFKTSLTMQFVKVTNILLVMSSTPIDLVSSVVHNATPQRKLCLCSVTFVQLSNYGKCSSRRLLGQTWKAVLEAASSSTQTHRTDLIRCVPAGCWCTWST